MSKLIKKIFVLSGPVHSGKTTCLVNWLKNITSASGILTPVIEGKRFFLDVLTKETFPMQGSPTDSNVIAIGRYIFNARAFDHAKEVLRTALNQRKDWLIIDEIGPLELKGGGFDNILREILSEKDDKHQPQKGNIQLILVIRESLVDAIVKAYGIETYEAFDQLLGLNRES